MDKNAEGPPNSVKVASLDIETLSVRMNAAIIEVGYVIGMVPVHVESMNYNDFVPIAQGTLSFDLLDQIKLGRHVDPSTIEFHERQTNEAAARCMIYGYSGSQHRSAFDQLTILKKLMKDVDELWLNHPTFDAGRLNTLAEQVSVDPLWRYSIEKDVATLKRMFGLDSNIVCTHRGLDDARYNLDLLKNFSATRVSRWHMGDGFVWSWRSEESKDSPDV